MSYCCEIDLSLKDWFILNFSSRSSLSLDQKRVPVGAVEQASSTKGVHYGRMINN